LTITMDAGQLWIRGERKFTHSEQKRWYDERFYGNFERAIALPDTVDPSAVEASLSDGVLAITVGKKPECQPYRVTIKSAGESENKRLTNAE
jgi:HSP20 family protein